MIVTQQPLNLSYFISDITSALALYDRIRWWRSRTGVGGLYEAATAAAAGPAVLDGSADSLHQLNGKTLSFKVNGVTVVDVLFSDIDPVTTSQVVTAVTSATGLVIPTSVGGRLRLTAVATGSVASIEILECDAAPYLGFDVGAAAVGLDADTVLSSGVHEYFELDNNSSTTFFYRVELRSSVTSQTTGLGPAFAPEPPGIPDTNRIWAYINLLDPTGRPIEDRVITLANPFLPNTVVVGSTTYGVFRQYAQMRTNNVGYAQIRLIRGMQVDINVDGSDFTRRLLIPTSGDSVDLLSPSLVVDDEFGIQQPDIDFAVRTS